MNLWTSRVWGTAPTQIIIERLLPARFREISANLGWLIANRLIRMALGVFVLGAVGRYLGPEQFGALNYAISLTAIFSAVANLGFEGIVIRELVNAPGSTGAILGTAFWMRLGGGLIAMALVALAALITNDGRGTALLTIIVAVIFLPGALEVIDLWFQKNIQAKYTVVARLLATLLASAMKIGLVFAGASLVIFAWAQVVDAALAGVALIWVFRWRGEHLSHWRFNREIARRLLRDSWPLMVSGVLVSIYMRIEQILVMTQLGKYSAGVYYASARVTEMWGFIPAMILATIYPILVEKRRQDHAKYKEKLQMVFDLLTGLGYAVAVGVTLLAPLIISSVFGPKYTGAVNILLIQAWTAPLTFNAGVRAQYLLLENLTIYHTISALMGIAANVTVALLLMPRLGAPGAALGGLTGYWISAHLSSILCKPLHECASLQTKAFLLPFRLPALIRRTTRAQ